MPWKLANRISVSTGVLVLAGTLGAIVLSACQPIEQATRSIEDSFTPASKGPPPLALKGEPDLRVRVQREATSITIDGPARVVVRTSQGPAPVSIACPIVVTSGARGLAVRDAKGTTRTWTFGVDVEIVASDARSTVGGASLPGLSLLRVNEVSFPGFVSIKPNWHDYPDRFDVIASMGLEAYLPGAVGDEMDTNWPRQALEAQAVVSRTQALFDMETARRTGKEFDAETSLERQRAMTGFGATQAMEAVRRTSGMVLKSGGRLIRAYENPTCGGRPASAADAFGATFGTEFNRAEPLVARTRDSACTTSPDYRWEVERRDEELSQRIRAWGLANTSAVAALTRVREIKVEQLNAAKRPTKFRLIDNGGREFVLGAEEFCQACNQNAIGQAPITAESRVRSGDVEVEVWANIVKFRGRGSGHGVGMCKQCAKGFAEQGWDWRRMVSQFYPGAEPTKMY